MSKTDITKNFAVLAYDQTTGGSYPLEHYSVWWHETEETARRDAMRGRAHKSYLIVRVIAEVEIERKPVLKEIS